MRYVPAHSNRWQNPKIKALSPLGKLLFDYLASNQSTTSAGIYPFSLAITAEETGIDQDWIPFLLEELSNVHERVNDHERRPLIRFDGFVVWVVGQWKHTVNQGWPHKAQVGLEFNRTFTLPYWKDFFETYPEIRTTLEKQKRFSGREAFLSNIHKARPGPENNYTAKVATTLFTSPNEGPTVGPYGIGRRTPLCIEERRGEGTPPPLSSLSEETKEKPPAVEPLEDSPPAPDDNYFTDTIPYLSGPGSGPTGFAQALAVKIKEDLCDPWGKVIDAKTGTVHENPKIAEPEPQEGNMKIPDAPIIDDIKIWRKYQSKLTTIEARFKAKLTATELNTLRERAREADRKILELHHDGQDPKKTPEPTIQIFGRTLRVGESIKVPVNIKPKPKPEDPKPDPLDSPPEADK